MMLRRKGQRRRPGVDLRQFKQLSWNSRSFMWSILEATAPTMLATPCRAVDWLRGSIRRFQVGDRMTMLIVESAPA